MFKNPCAYRKIYYIVSAVLIVVSIVSMIVRGFNYGIDFTSGTTFEFTLPETYTYSPAMEEDVRKLVTDAAGGVSTQIQQVGTDGMFIKMSEIGNAETDKVVNALLGYFGNEDAVEVATETASEIETVLEAETASVASETETETASVPAEAASVEATETETAAEAAETATELESETASEAATEAPANILVKSAIKIDKVSASTSSRLIGNTFMAVLLAIILMLAYISIRFDFKSGVSAIAALAHDVILMFGFYSLFQLTINTSFVAAVLTIIGYSINATIVVFDRVRENVKNMKKTTFDEKADAAIRSSYTRTLYSSLTTLFTIGALFVLGVSSIREFALPIIVGIICGAYSSLFVAPTLWAVWKQSAVKDAKGGAKKK